MPRSEAGIAAGVLGMQRLLAGAVVLAANGGIFQALNDGSGVSAGAVGAALIVPLVVLLIGVAAAWKLIPPSSRPHEPRLEHHRFHF